LTTDGSNFTYTKEDAEPTSPDVLRGDTKKGPGISSAPSTIIPNPTQKVKTFGKKERLIAKWVRQQRAFAFERFTFQ